MLGIFVNKDFRYRPNAEPLLICWLFIEIFDSLLVLSKKVNTKQNKIHKLIINVLENILVSTKNRNYNDHHEDIFERFQIWAHFWKTKS